MKTIYLQESLSLNGRNSLKGRKLFEKFKSSSDEILLGFVIVSDDYFNKVQDENFKRDLIPEKILWEFSPDIIYIEGGMFASKDMWKVPKELCDQLLNDGTSIIIGDTDINHLAEHKNNFKDLFSLVHAWIDFGDVDSNRPLYGGERHGSPAELICYPEKMIISDWLKPVYENVDSVIVSWAMKISSWESLLISGNQGSTGTLSNDMWVDEFDCCPFGSVAQISKGYIAFISGLTTYFSEENEGNLNFLFNLSSFLYNESKLLRERVKSHYYSKHSLFLSHRSSDKNKVDDIAKILKKNGIGIWYDKEKLLPSDSLTKKISEGLSEMTHFVLFWSASCLDSNWVDRELNSAISQLIENGKPIIIVRLDETKVPTLISDLYRIEGQDMSVEEVGKTISDTIERLEKRKTAGNNV